jgi:tRNA(fMet)-specific endonuclease VapC
VTEILIDTNVYSQLYQKNFDVFLLLENAGQVVVPLVVIAELRAGFWGGTKKEINETHLNKFLSKVRIISPDTQTTVEYASIFAALKRQGNPIPTNDIWIAALALQHQMSLMTFDKHFGFIPNLSVIDPNGVTGESAS